MVKVNARQRIKNIKTGTYRRIENEKLQVQERGQYETNLNNKLSETPEVMIMRGEQWQQIKKAIIEAMKTI